MRFFKRLKDFKIMFDKLSFSFWFVFAAFFLEGAECNYNVKELCISERFAAQWKHRKPQIELQIFGSRGRVLNKFYYFFLNDPFSELNFLDWSPMSSSDLYKFRNIKNSNFWYIQRFNKISTKMLRNPPENICWNSATDY